MHPLVQPRKVLIAAKVHTVLLNGLAEMGYDCINEESILQEDAMAKVKDCIGIITGNRLLLSKEVLQAAPNLSWIGRMGSGMEIIDTEFATAKGIHLFSSPEGNRNAVAEHALGMLLSISKKISHSHAEVKDGKWLREENRGWELEGRTIGIIGFGNTGSAFAKKLSSLDMRILAYDPLASKEMPDYVVRCTDLKMLQAEAEIISFHVPLNRSTYHYLNEDFIKVMQRPFLVINTARGSVVKASAVLEGIENGKVLGYAADVWEEEPLHKMGKAQKAYLAELLAYPQVIVTPHIAGYTFEALYKMSKVLLGKIADYGVKTSNTNYLGMTNIFS